MSCMPVNLLLLGVTHLGIALFFVSENAQKSHSALEAMLGVSLRDYIRNEEIRKRWAGHIARRTDGRRGPKVSPQWGGQMASSESLGAAGNKRPRTMYFRTL
ncbi:jg2226 [Pararge aegeria aegeria]|uniref:Jg2226 protein n=1 Tax=Pararge aegeria aegeria TaxID=348720 RepID=A0A8S4SMN3_9NEOP|nr:jg2226 [Pararge aegeria aegeria]